MSAFAEDENAPIASNAAVLSLDERLLMIDAAYAQGSRETCIYLIDDLYSSFDVAE